MISMSYRVLAGLFWVKSDAGGLKGDEVVTLNDLEIRVTVSIPVATLA